MKRWWVPLLALPLIAAAPRRQFNMVAPQSDSALLNPSNPAPVRRTPGPTFTPAPLPNRDLSAPQGPRASNAPSLSPSLFTRRDQYRGEGFSPNSTAQIDQERRVKPGAGFSLHMPLTGE